MTDVHEVAVGPPAADPTAGEPTTQRERLRRRRLGSSPVSFPRDPVAYAAATTAFAQALIEAKRNPSAAAAALVARAQLDAIEVETFTVRAIPSPEWEALIALHPPLPDQAAQGAEVNRATWRPAVLAACVAPPPGEPAYTEDDWNEFARDGRVSAGEQDTLLNTAVLLNARAVQVDPGKGLTATPS